MDKYKDLPGKAWERYKKLRSANGINYGEKIAQDLERQVEYAFATGYIEGRNDAIEEAENLSKIKPMNSFIPNPTPSCAPCENTDEKEPVFPYGKSFL